MKVACCGEHTTHSAGWKEGSPPEYPARLGALLGDAAEVGNFGFATAVVTNIVSDLAKAGKDGKQGKARVYSETAEAAACVAFRPDVIVLGPFGKHDALGPFSTHNNYDDDPLFGPKEYTAGLRALVRCATETAGAKRVILALPIPYPHGSTERTTSTLVLPCTVDLAAEPARTCAPRAAPARGRSSPGDRPLSAGEAPLAPIQGRAPPPARRVHAHSLQGRAQHEARRARRGTQAIASEATPEVGPRRRRRDHRRPGASSRARRKAHRGARSQS